MQFNNFDWADSQIEEIFIKYDELTMKIHNDTLDNDVLVICDKFAGITNLCIWDDTDIDYAKMEEADEKSEFYNTIIKAYTYTDGSLDATNENRTLSNGLKKLSIKLTNGIICEIYCQSVDVQIL